LPQARWAALHALALLGEQMPLSQRIPLEPVLTALEAEDVETRRGAVEVLDSFGPRVPVDRLLPLLDEEDTQVALRLFPRPIGLATGRTARAGARWCGRRWQGSTYPWPTSPDRPGPA
jgi:HEAT repeat protein